MPDHEQRAVQEVPRVFARDGELRLRHHLAKRRAAERDRSLAGGLGNGGEVLARQRLHARLEAIGRDLHAALVLLDPDVGLRKLLDDLEQLLRRQRERSAGGDRGRASAPQPDLEVGGGHAHVLALGVDQDVGQDGNRVLALHDALEKLQFFQEVVLADDEFHM